MNLIHESVTPRQFDCDVLLPVFLISGDVLLSLDGRNLEGMAHKEVAELLANSPSVIAFTVWREGERGGSEGGGMRMGGSEGVRDEGGREWGDSVRNWGRME